MSGADPAATAQGNQPPHIERPARVLLGWLSPDQAECYQSGHGSRKPQAEDASRAERARAAVSERAIGIDQTGVVIDAPG